MFLLEHDAKDLLSKGGVPIPPGYLATNVHDCETNAALPGALVVKGQIPAGGRGKAGIIVKADDAGGAAKHVKSILGRIVKGHAVNSVRVECDVGVASEAYIAFMLAPERAEVRVIVSARGGVDIEQLSKETQAVYSDVTSLDKRSLVECVHRVSRNLPPNIASAVQQAGALLADVFLEYEALLLEINPLFVKADGSWVAGDAKLVVDDNALVRQPKLQKVLQARSADYPEISLKFANGFDYVVVDPLGEIGLITSGAGLCMMLLDELRAHGLRPYNFLDVRAGAFHGKTTRMVQVLNWIRAGRNVKLVLVNIVAGGIDLGEFARVLFASFEETGFKVPFVVRFAGRNLAEAQQILKEKGVAMHMDLDSAIAEVSQRLSVLK